MTDCFSGSMEPTLAGLGGDLGALAEEGTTIAVDGRDLEINSNLHFFFGKISMREKLG